MVFTCDLLKDGMEAIEVLGAIGMEEDVEWRARAPDGSWPLIAAEAPDDLAVDAVPVADLHIVVLAHVVEFQAQHDEPVGREGAAGNRWALDPPVIPEQVQGQMMNRSRKSSATGLIEKGSWTVWGQMNFF